MTLLLPKKSERGMINTSRQQNVKPERWKSVSRSSAKVNSRLFKNWAKAVNYNTLLLHVVMKSLTMQSSFFYPVTASCCEVTMEITSACSWMSGITNYTSSQMSEFKLMDLMPVRYTYPGRYALSNISKILLYVQTLIWFSIQFCLNSGFGKYSHTLKI